MDKQTKHIMVDLETLSTTTSAVVLSIGAVVFDPYTNIKDEFYHELRLEDQKFRHCSISTVEWWIKQVAKHPERASIFTNEHKTPVRNALLLLRDFINVHVKADEDLALWACDPDFDVAILTNLFTEYALPLPWKYYAGKSVRTVRMLAKEFDLPRPEQEKTHNALEDCIRQANEVINFYKCVGAC